MEAKRVNSSPSDGCNTIEASIQSVKTKRRRKKRPKQQKSKRVSSSLKLEHIPTLKPTSSLKLLLREAKTTNSCVKILSAPQLTQRKQTASPPIIELDFEPSKKYSTSLFGSDSAFSIPESPVFNRTRELGLSSVTTLDDTFLSGYEERVHQNSEMMLQSQLDRDWEHLSEHLTPRHSGRNSQREQLISPMEDHDRSEVTLNEAFESPVHESNYELSSQCDHHSSESEQRSEVNEFQESVNERLRSQYLNQTLINQQNHQISMQLCNFECFVREKIEAAEDYVKTILTQIEDSNSAVLKAMNDLKRVRREPDRTTKLTVSTRQRTGSELVMPKIPVSKDFSLAILNSALKKTQYMNQFVSQISRMVTLNGYNPRKTVKSIMTKLFTLNLLVKYKWSRKMTGNKKPAFSSLTNVLRAIATLLTNFMPENVMRREMKLFFKEIPRIYEEQKLRDL